MKIVLLDAGHGGVIGGKYQTPGKRSYFKKDKKGNMQLMDSKKLDVKELEETCDVKYYEGEGNRKIRDIVCKMCLKAGIKFVHVTTGNEDVGLSDRVKIVNNYAKKYGKDNLLLISIHSDAFSKESAHGPSVYTSKGQTGSDKVATEWVKQAEKMWPDEKIRKDNTDGDPDKEANFTVLKRTDPRAILVENFFFTNWKDYSTHLATAEGRNKIATVIFKTIEECL